MSRSTLAARLCGPTGPLLRSILADPQPGGCRQASTVLTDPNFLHVWHLGGTRIPGAFGLGVLVTMDAPQGADLLELVRPTRTVPIHHGD